MFLPDGTLLVCYLHEEHSVEAHRPRVLVWHDRADPEEVVLSTASRQLLAELAMPQLELPPGLSPAAATRRVAAALAAPLPRREVSQLRAALHYSKTQEWRVRRGLLAELDRYGLARHLISETRGRVVLASARTDISMLSMAVRDGRLDDAALLLRIVARDRPELLEFAAPRAWPLRGAAHVQSALEQATEHLCLDAELSTINVDIVDAVVVEDATTVLEQDRDTDEGTGPESDLALTVHDVEAAALKRGAIQLPVLISTCRVRRWRVVLRVARALALPALFVAVLTMLVVRGGEPEPKSIPSSVAGPFPQDDTTAIANLTLAIPFDPSEMPGTDGDILLVRQRFRVIKSTGSRSLRTTLNIIRRSADRVEVSFLQIGPLQRSGGSVGARNLTLRNRLRAVPGSSFLLDVDGAVVRPLPDLMDGREVTIDGLRPGKVYYIETRVKVITTPSNVRGEFGYQSVGCSPRGASDPEAHVRDGDVVTCEISLWNWGPGALRSTVVRFVPTQGNVRQISLPGSYTSADADPRSAATAGGYINVHPMSDWALRYVPGSAKVRRAARTETVDGDPLKGGVTVANVPGTPTGDFKQMPRLSFEAQALDMNR